MGKPPPTQPQYLTDEQLAAIREAWAAGLHRDQVAAAAGITIHVLEARRADQLRDLPARGRGAGGGRRPKLPPPEVIAVRAHEVRSRWPVERWIEARQEAVLTTRLSPERSTRRA